MVKMGTVWDRTVDVLNGRGAIVARIAIVTLFLPAVLQEAVPLVLGGGAGARVTTLVLGIALLVAMVLGMLALTAVASDPATDERTAYRIAGRALPGAIGAMVLIGIVFAILLVPAIVLLVGSGIDFRAAAAGVAQENASVDLLGGFLLYLLVLLLVWIWAAARLILLYAAIVNERRGVSAIRRSFALTRGLALRIVGVVILYGIVVSVAVLAVQSVAGLVFRLALGADRAVLVAVLTGIVVSVVTTGFSVLQPIFAARLYAAVRETREASTPA